MASGDDCVVPRTAGVVAPQPIAVTTPTAVPTPASPTVRVARGLDRPLVAGGATLFLMGWTAGAIATGFFAAGGDECRRSIAAWNTLPLFGTIVSAGLIGSCGWVSGVPWGDWILAGLLATPLQIVGLVLAIVGTAKRVDVPLRTGVSLSPSGLAITF